METNVKGLQHMEVDDIDDEIYYREMLGCTAQLEGPGTCATVSCPNEQLRVCEKPGAAEARRNAPQIDPTTVMDAC